MTSTTTGTPDPIFAAIEAHEKATDALMTMHEQQLAENPPRYNSNGNMICRMVGSDHPAAVAVMACFKTEAALIDTAPRTQAGLTALAAHLRDDRYKHARERIPELMTPKMYLQLRDENLTIEDGWRVVIDDRAFVDWFIAKRGAEISAA
jgi:hypothetical protein